MLPCSKNAFAKRPSINRAAVLTTTTTTSTVFTTTAILVVWVGGWALSGCQKEPIQVLDLEASTGGDFGRAELRTAIDKFRNTPTSAKAYRQLASEIDAMRPRLDREHKATADRMLAFLALGPLEANYSLPAKENMEVLAATVWPTVLGVPPEPGEGGMAYLKRVCGGELAGECKFIVPEYWPTLIAANVWRRFRHLARERFTACRECQNDPTFLRALSRFDELATPLETLAATLEEEAHPRNWPRAQPHAEPWPRALVTLAMTGSGALKISGKRVSTSDWRTELRAVAPGSQIGLYLRPELSVARLRQLLRDLNKLGYTQADLQTRLPTYPYDLRGYSLTTRPTTAALRVKTRDTDTIAVMVLAADQARGQAIKKNNNNNNTSRSLLSIF